MEEMKLFEEHHGGGGETGDYGDHDEDYKRDNEGGSDEDEDDDDSDENEDDDESSEGDNSDVQDEVEGDLGSEQQYPKQVRQGLQPFFAIFFSISHFMI